MGVRRDRTWTTVVLTRHVRYGELWGLVEIIRVDGDVLLHELGVHQVAFALVVRIIVAQFLFDFVF